MSSSVKSVTIESHARILSSSPNRLGKYDHVISYLTQENKRGRIRIQKDPISDIDIQQAVQDDIKNFKSMVGKKINVVY